MESNELCQEFEDYRTFQADGGEGLSPELLSYRRNGLVVEMKHKSHLWELSTVSKSDLLAGPAILDP